jgi:predicted metal-dependent phosphoesterase TrpH
VTGSELSANLADVSGFDMHVHSTFSDGTQSVTENVQMALERGLEGIAITDHDTTAGFQEAQAASEATGIKIVPGLEFSAEYDGASLHVLGYWIDPSDPDLRAELERLIATRFRRGEMMIEKLQEAGYEISFERVRQIAGDDLIARPHIAEAMVEAGIVATEKEAFDRFISDGGPAYVPKHALDPVVSVALIRAAGGACVLAHPGMWRGESSVPVSLIERMAEAGMAGLEVDHPDHDDAQRAEYRQLAARLDLIATGASDCHGERFGFRLGRYTTAPEVVAELKAKAGRPDAPATS